MSTRVAALWPSGELPPVPAKRYFTRAEAEVLCAAPQPLLERWFRTYLAGACPRPRRYWLRHEVLALRRIRTLLVKGLTPEAVRGLVDAAELLQDDAVNAYRLLETAASQTEERLNALLALLDSHLLPPPSAS